MKLCLCGELRRFTHPTRQRNMLAHAQRHRRQLTEETMHLFGKPAGRPLFCALALALALVPYAFAQQRADESYAAKIKEYTTEKYFLTELVDHLPADARVPSPDKV